MHTLFITALIILFSTISYAQTTVNIDSSSNVNIYNYGTVIENNQGTVNIVSKSQNKSWENDTRCNFPSNQSKGRSYSPIFNRIIGLILLLMLPTGALFLFISDYERGDTVTLKLIISCIIVIIFLIVIYIAD